jgi:hypothetical protein
VTPTKLSRSSVTTSVHPDCPRFQEYRTPPFAISSVPSGVHAQSASVLPATAGIRTVVAPVAGSSSLMTKVAVSPDHSRCTKLIELTGVLPGIRWIDRPMSLAITRAVPVRVSAICSVAG